jgi:hypothetical protein
LKIYIWRKCAYDSGTQRNTGILADFAPDRGRTGEAAKGNTDAISKVSISSKGLERPVYRFLQRKKEPVAYLRSLL